MGCCFSSPGNVEMTSISAVEAMLENINLDGQRSKDPEVSIQGPNPLTFQNVTLSDTSSDIDEELIAEMTKSDDEVKQTKSKIK